ncbi:hypothetical protein, partial [Sinorhizobium meliloti]|uniref:hypothetical protein n=1 Tax=Rhizobium meliloti TaxID=382 RepID=UPI001AECC1EA
GMGRGKDTVRRHLWRAVLQLMKPAHRTEFLTVPHVSFNPIRLKGKNMQQIKVLQRPLRV